MLRKLFNKKFLNEKLRKHQITIDCEKKRFKPFFKLTTHEKLNLIKISIFTSFVLKEFFSLKQIEYIDEVKFILLMLSVDIDWKNLVTICIHE